MSNDILVHSVTYTQTANRGLRDERSHEITMGTFCLRKNAERNCPSDGVIVSHAIPDYEAAKKCGDYPDQPLNGQLIEYH